MMLRERRGRDDDDDDGEDEKSHEEEEEEVVQQQGEQRPWGRRRRWPVRCQESSPDSEESWECGPYDRSQEVVREVERREFRCRRSGSSGLSRFQRTRFRRSRVKFPWCRRCSHVLRAAQREKVG